MKLTMTFKKVDDYKLLTEDSPRHADNYAIMLVPQKGIFNYLLDRLSRDTSYRKYIIFLICGLLFCEYSRIYNYPDPYNKHILSYINNIKIVMERFVILVARSGESFQSFTEYPHLTSYHDVCVCRDDRDRNLYNTYFLPEFIKSYSKIRNPYTEEISKTTGPSKRG